MSWATWLAVVGICMLGAMSPGPSLAVVLRHTLSGGRRNGVTTALLHGLGVGFYALLSIVGLAAVITAAPLAFAVLQWGGAGYLVWLGVQGLRAKPATEGDFRVGPSQASSARDGFLVVFLNPKIAVFFLALFSQVVGLETSFMAKLAYAATAMIIDGGWYLLVVWLFSNPRWMATLQRSSQWLERVFGVVLIALAGRLVVGILGS